MMKYHKMKCVYCLDFPDGKKYVGSAKDLGKRVREHQQPSNNKGNTDLKAAIAMGNYEVVILEQCPDNYTKEQLEDREQHYVNLWWDYGILYNMKKNVRGCCGRKRCIAWQYVDEIKAEFEAGKSKRKLAQQYNCRFQTIERILITCEGKKLNSVIKLADEIKADYAAGLGKSKLTRKYKCSNYYINKILAS